MTINLKKPDIAELKPRITVFGVGGGGGNAVNNMITCGLEGVEFVVANTDAQALMTSKSERIIQLGAAVTEGLGAGSHPEVGQAAAEECIDEIMDYLSNTHMCFVTAGMGGGTGTGAAPVVAKAAREKGILTVGVVTKPFQFEGQRRMKTAEQGIEELQKCVDTLIVIPNQNLFRIANEKTTFSEAFAMADQVLFSGVACITDLMVKEGLINLDFADVRSVMHQMGKAMMGTGEASGDDRAVKAAEAAISNPLLDEVSMRGAKGLLISITGGRDLTLFEVDEAATRIREEVDPDANIILGATHDDSFEGKIRVSVVATGIDSTHNGVEQGSSYVEDNQLKRAADSVLTRRQESVSAGHMSRKSLTELTPEAQKLQLDENRLATKFASQFSSSFANSANRKVMAEEELSFADLEDDIVSEQRNEPATAPHNYRSYRDTEAYTTLNRRSFSRFSNDQSDRYEKSLSNTTSDTKTTTSSLASGGTLSGTSQPWSSQPQVKPLSQELPEISDFPSIVQHTRLDIDELACFDEDSSDGPRGLWQKITHRLRSKQAAMDLASLEPVESDTGYEEMMERSSSAQQEVLYEERSGDTRADQREVETNLDIPAFLRQHANS